ncbi:DUF6072 family protein [Paraliomyxa miuraensis]|uniref:DUF6072 family protein n=1 Tax=Paraliomyxa miuraensis TaxID=376150 RepID=UPI0022559D34|nr:DUF6072 family protein [Paraliomyxa miuraensis]MCX4246653.1 hypothetical protein [Paraliomyxa miuraensis]
MDEQNNTVNNAIKLIGESFAPGASLLMDGKILPGAAHLLVGMWTRAVLGPVGLGLVMANSYATSTTGKSLLKQFKGEPAKDEPAKDEPAAAEEAQ